MVSLRLGGRFAIELISFDRNEILQGFTFWS